MHHWKDLCTQLFLVLSIVGYAGSLPGLKGDLGDQLEDKPERVEDEIDEEELPSIAPTLPATEAEIDADKIISVDPTMRPRSTIAATSPRTRPTPVYKGNVFGII